MNHGEDIRTRILEVNHQYIAVNKPAGMPVQSDPSGDPALLDLVSAYARQPLHLINRLDRPVSGVVLFGRKRESTASLNQQFSMRQVRKEYLAVTESGRTGQEELVHWLKKLPGSAKVVLCEPGEKDSQECHLPVTWIGMTDNYALCQVSPDTGYPHQIRAQLAYSGCPIKGDVKYGARRRNKDRSIHLHAWRLHFSHPVSGQAQMIEAPLPEDALWSLFYEKDWVKR